MVDENNMATAFTFFHKILFAGLPMHKMKQAPSGRELSPKVTEGEGGNQG